MAKTTWTGARRFWFLPLPSCCAASRFSPYSPPQARKNGRRTGGRSPVWADRKAQRSRRDLPGPRSRCSVPTKAPAIKMASNSVQTTSWRRRAAHREPAAAAKAPNEYALNQVPPVNDPALEAYRRQNNYAYTPPPPPPVTTAVAPVPQPMNESEGLKKPSLVFVRNTTSATAINASQSTAQPAVIERKGVSTLLPTGSRLVARLQTAVSSAVKTPAIAVIEYNYERNGEIVIPAGTKAIGQLAQANRMGR